MTSIVIVRVDRSCSYMYVLMLLRVTEEVSHCLALQSSRKTQPSFFRSDIQIQFDRDQRTPTMHVGCVVEIKYIYM